MVRVLQYSDYRHSKDFFSCRIELNTMRLCLKNNYYYWITLLCYFAV